jgi:hypothetical protein
VLATGVTPRVADRVAPVEAVGPDRVRADGTVGTVRAFRPLRTVRTLRAVRADDAVGAIRPLRPTAVGEGRRGTEEDGEDRGVGEFHGALLGWRASRFIQLVPGSRRNLRGFRRP